MKKTALIVCHDAGGANLINSWKRNNNSKYKYYLYIAGPAKKIFKGKDQSLFAFEILQNPDLFELIKIPEKMIYVNDIWFYLEEYFSDV
jgi:hypothetical protein